jgi:glycosyltransferase involved in cell wall biosynthesis
MKLSFLLPSRNRLQLLKHAIDSIQRQRIDDYEILVADNASEEDYAGYVKSLGDPRIQYSRSAESLPVTENWRRSLSMASGDYVLMLGDDDALVPWFHRSVRPLIERAEAPDVVYLAAFHYCYPGVMPGSPRGYLADVKNSRFLDGRTTPFELPREEAHAVANAAFEFRYLFGFNSQHFLFSAKFLRELDSLGGVFQSPYPDTFAAVASFLLARRIVVLPEPVIMIGISPKSFGYYYFNNRQAEGSEFLANERVSPEVRSSLANVVLPGDNNNTNWLVAVEVARRALGAAVKSEVDIGRYRMLQAVAFLRSHPPAGDVDAFVAKLDSRERAVFAALQALAAAAERQGPKSLLAFYRTLDSQLAQFWPARVRWLKIGPHASIRDAYDWLEREGSYAKLPEASRGLRRILGL